MGPIETAYRAFAQLAGAALVEAGFLAQAEALQVDPEGDVAVALAADGRGHTGAGLIQSLTLPARAHLGGGAARFVVERRVSLQLGAAGDKAWVDQVLDDAVTAIADLIVNDPTLGEACERAGLESADYADLANSGGRAVALAIVLRVPAADPVGALPAA